MIPAGVLARQRRAAERAMPSRAVHYPRTVTNVRGREGATHAAGETYACRLISKAATSEEEGGKAVSRMTFRALLPWNAPVNARDRLVINGVTYEVTGSDYGQDERIQLTVTLARND